MPPNSRTAKNGQRFYVWGRGERYWSVTTILGALPKPALKAWAARTVAEFAFDRSKTWFTMSREEAVAWLKSEPLRYTAGRADVGSAIHAAAEAWVLRQPMRGDFGDEERKAIGHFISWVQLLDVKFLETEASVYNRTEKYAGTLDCIVEISYRRLVDLAGGNAALVPWIPREGRETLTLLGDYKTGGDVDEGKGVYPEVALQLVAYGRAEFVGAPNGAEVPLPVIDGAFCLHLQAAGWRLVPVNIGKDPRLLAEGEAPEDDVWKSFLYAREVFRWIEQISKEVLGTPLAPPPAEIPADHAPAPEGDTPDETPAPAPEPSRRRRRPKDPAS